MMARLPLLTALLAACLLALPCPADQPDEAALLAVLKNPQASRYDKHEACRQLARVATTASLPVLADLLCDEQLSHMARYALESIDDPAADQVLRQALAKADGPALVGIVGSLGARRDVQAVAPLARLLDTDRPDLLTATAHALGNIGTDQAAQALLEQLDKKPGPDRLTPLCQGLLRCAEALADAGRQERARDIYDRLRHIEQAPLPVRAAALRGSAVTRGPQGLDLLLPLLKSGDYPTFAAAVRAAMDLPGTQVTTALADRLADLPVQRQVVLVRALAERGDQAAAAKLMGLLDGPCPPLRIEAAKALTRLAWAPAVPRLIEMALDEDGEPASTASQCLAGFAGSAVDKATADLLDDDQPAARRLGISLAGQRRLTAAVPRLMKIAGAGDPEQAAAAVAVVGELADARHLPALLDLLAAADSPQVRQAVGQAVQRLCIRQDQPQAHTAAIVAAMDKAPVPAKVQLLDILRVLGGPQALQAVIAASAHHDQQVSQAAVKALCQWPNDRALPAVSALAKQPPNDLIRVLALRGWVRMLQEQKAPAADKLKQLRQAMTLCRRAEEKRLVLGAVQNLASPAALAMVSRQLDDPAVRKEAAAAALGLAGKLADRQPDAVVGAMEYLLALADQEQNQDLAAQARPLLARAENKALRALGYRPAGPWKELFNRQNLAGWQPLGQARFYVKDYCLVGTQTDGRGGDLKAPGQWADFELRLTYRVKWPANSGLWYRWDGKRGYQFDILKYANPVAFSGTLYCPGKMFILKNLDESLEHRDGWNTARIRAAGKHLTHWLNGCLLGTVEDDSLSSGAVGLQVHGGEGFKGMQILVRQLLIRPLKPASPRSAPAR